MDPVHRATARVLPVSQDGAVLLLEERDPARPGERYWSSIGGAPDLHESLRTAAARELREEAGIHTDGGRLIGPVFRDRQAYSWDGVDYVGEHTYFALPLERGVEISFDGLEPEEVGTVLGAGWWLPTSLAGVLSRPADLPDIMTSAIAAVRGQQ
ncbi:NUDIX domain-containing protein [Nocardioides sp. HB32]|jgi:8-oxo-dGTP pyrophosphatase MutT (NUDIX family)